MLSGGRVQTPPSSVRSTRILRISNFLWAILLFACGLLLGIPLQALLNSNYYSSSTFENENAAQLSELFKSTDRDLKNTIHILHDKLSSTLASIEEKQSLLNSTLLEVEKAKKHLKDVVYISGEKIPNSILVSSGSLDAIADETAKLAGVPRASVVTVNFTRAVQDRLDKELAERMPFCVNLLCQCEEEQRNASKWRQLAAQASKEKRVFAVIRGFVERMDYLEEWAGKQNLTFGEAKKKLKADGDKAEEDLRNYVFYHTLYLKYWDDRKDETHLRYFKGLLERSVREEASTRANMEASRKLLEGCKGALLSNCSWKLPRSDWEKDHDQVLKEYREKRSLAENGTFSGAYEYGSCSLGDNIEDRSRVGMAAPFELWRRDPELYPDRVNVTFVLQYYKTDVSVFTEIVNNLWQCTEGILGKGQLPGVTSQLVVNIEQADEMQQWMELWHKYEKGEFLIPIFTHGVGAQRAFNSGARASKGYVVVFLHENSIPPKNCSWVSGVLGAMERWPQVAALGLNRGTTNGRGRHSWSRGDLRMRDPVTKTRFQFAEDVQFVPSAVRRADFLQVGGFDESLIGAEGPNAEAADRQLAARMWLSGRQVAQLFIDESFKMVEWKKSSLWELGEKSTEENRKAFEAGFGKYEKVVVEEVRRLNKLLEIVDPWD